MQFRLVRIELNEQNSIVAQTETRPFYELRDDAMQMAEFGAARCGGEYGYNREKDYWWGRDIKGRRFRFEVHAIEATDVAA